MGWTILITGTSSGIGLEAAVMLAAMGGELVLVARNRAPRTRASTSS